MKKALLVFLLVALALVVGVAVAAADSDQAALIITLEEGCIWGTDTLTAEGSVHYVEVNHGQWKLTCIGEIVDGPLPAQAVIERSTEENPLAGYCETPFGTTQNWQGVYTPGGQSTFVCHGDLSP